MACQRAVRFSMFFFTTRVGVSHSYCALQRGSCGFHQVFACLQCSISGAYVYYTWARLQTFREPKHATQPASRGTIHTTMALKSRTAETIPQSISSVWHSSCCVIVYIFSLVNAMSILNRQPVSHLFKSSTVLTSFRTFLYGTLRVQRERACQCWCTFFRINIRNMRKKLALFNTVVVFNISHYFPNSATPKKFKIWVNINSRQVSQSFLTFL